MTCGVKGPARGTGGLAGRVVDGTAAGDFAGCVMDGAAGMEGERTLSSLTTAGVFGALMARGRTDCAGADERRVGMRDMRFGRAEMDSPGVVVSMVGADAAVVRVSNSSVSLSLSASPLLLPLLSMSGGAWSRALRIL